MSELPPTSYPPFGPPPYGYAAGSPPKKGAGLAIASMVLGIMALLLGWLPVINILAGVLALVGLGLGIPALVLARRGTHDGTGMAITGIVTSALALVLVVLTLMLFVAGVDQVDQGVGEATSEPSATASAAGHVSTASFDSSDRVYYAIG